MPSSFFARLRPVSATRLWSFRGWARAYRDAGDLAAAAAAPQQARRTGDDSADVLQDLAVVLAAQGKTAEARKTFEELVRRNGSAPTTLVPTSASSSSSRRAPIGCGRSALRQAVEREPTYGEAWQALWRRAGKTILPAQSMPGRAGGPASA